MHVHAPGDGLAVHVPQLWRLCKRLPLAALRIACHAGMVVQQLLLAVVDVGVHGVGVQLLSSCAAAVQHKVVRRRRLPVQHGCVATACAHGAVLRHT